MALTPSRPAPPGAAAPADAGRRALLAWARAGAWAAVWRTAGRASVGAGLLAAGAAQAQPRQAEVSEAGVKAAYLYKFLAYVDWPLRAQPAAEAPHVIGVLGAEPVLAELEALLAGRRHRGHPLLARRLLPGDGVEGIHVLHVGRGTRPPAALTAALAGKPVLVVSDLPAPAEWSVLNFVTVEQRVRFEASLGAAERAGLRLSARLLAVAERVVPADRAAP